MILIAKQGRFKTHDTLSKKTTHEYDIKTSVAYYKQCYY